MRYLTDMRRAVVFFCDGCGKRLDDADPGDPFWEDYDRFLVTVGQPDEEPTFLLCASCFKARGGPGKEWYRIEWHQHVSD
jgi:hypothetical protein